MCVMALFMALPLSTEHLGARVLMQQAVLEEHCVESFSRQASVQVSKCQEQQRLNSRLTCQEQMFLRTTRL